MDFIQTFLDAPKLSQLIIIVINCITLIYFLATFRSRDILVYFFLWLISFIGIFFLLQLFSSLTFKLYFLFYGFPGIFLALIIISLLLIFPKNLLSKKLGPFDIKIPVKNKPDIVINILKGVSVQGAAGSGKTVSIAGWILKWLGERSIPGLIYDYKNFELVEIVLWFYRNASIPVNIFSPAEPEKSLQLNPIHPDILKNQEDVLLMSKTIVSNVIEKEAQNSFFNDAVEGAISGVLIKLKEDFPHYCSFPYLTAIFLSMDTERLVTFIESNTSAARQARPFLDSALSSRQMAGVKGTLSNAFRKFDLPNLFYCLNGNQVQFDLNNSQHKSVLCLVNKPKYGEIYEPILSIVAQATILSMSKRDKDPSYLLFDEAPTLKVHKIERVPATMRSFNIATIYMLQDKIQAVNQLGLNRMKEVLANLSNLFFGKTNDPDTAKYFESFFELIKVKHKSFSSKRGFFFGGNDSRITTSERDEKKNKSFEMFKRNTGSFFIFDEKGKTYDATIKKPSIELEKVKSTNTVTDWDIKNNYSTIINNINRL